MGTIKAGGSESMYRQRGRPTPPPPHRIKNSVMVEMHVNSPIFQGQFIEKN